MKPRNKHERRIVELSSALRPLTDEQKQWAQDKAFSGYVVRSRRSLYCLECGAKWKEENSLHLNILKVCTCPECDKELKFREGPNETHYMDAEYMAFISVKNDFQVIRIAKCHKHMKKKLAARYCISEVLQQWIDPNGNLTVMAKSINGQSFYRDSWIDSSELSIKNTIGSNNTYDYRGSAYNVSPYLVHPKRKILPIIKRNGFKGHFYGISPRRLFLNLIHSAYSETLLKAGQIELLKIHCYDGGRNTTKYWNSIKICIRNGYIVKNPSDWFDTLSLLDRFGKDLLNPKYVCPPILRKSHDYWVEKKRLQDKRKKDEDRRARIQSAQKRYYKTHGKYIGLEFTSEDITVKFLKHVQQFADTGDKLKHCIFTNEYYEKKESVCFAAYHNQILVETVEFSPESMKVIQSRGQNNLPSPHHDKIMALVNENALNIRNYGKSKRRPESFQGQQRDSA